MTTQPKCLIAWRSAIYKYFDLNKKPKTIIVNRDDLEDYEEYLSNLYLDGVIPIEDGLLKYKGIPIGYSETLARNEVVIEE